MSEYVALPPASFPGSLFADDLTAVVISRERSLLMASAPKVFTQTATTPIGELDCWQQVGEEEARMAYEMTLNNELSGGTEQVRLFEEEWRQFVGTKHAVTVCNGTVSLWSAMYGLGVGPGDEVIAPVNTWICTISPAVMLGAKPILADVDPNTLLLDIEDVKKRITPKTKAIVPVHLWGWVADMDAWMDLSRETGIPIIEDCSHAHGAMYKGKMTGSVGHVGCWSMQGSKAVSAGEGGIIATDDDEIMDRACLLGQCNRVAGLDLVTENYEKYQPLGLGIKFRSQPVGIGIARVQLKKLPKLNAGRKAWIETIEAGLKDIPGIEPIQSAEGSERGGFYGFPVLFHGEQAPGITRDQYAEALNKHGVPVTTRGYGLLSELPLFSEGFDVFGNGRGSLIEGYTGVTNDDFPGGVELCDRTIFLPKLTDPVDGAVEEVLRRMKTATESLGL